MAEPARRPARFPFERLAAWVVTGPVGHFYSVAADLAVYFVRSRLRRLQRRLAGAGRRPSARR